MSRTSARAHAVPCSAGRSLTCACGSTSRTSSGSSRSAPDGIRPSRIEEASGSIGRRDALRLLLAPSGSSRRGFTSALPLRFSAMLWRDRHRRRNSEVTGWRAHCAGGGHESKAQERRRLRLTGGGGWAAGWRSCWRGYSARLRSIPDNRLLGDAAADGPVRLRAMAGCRCSCALRPSKPKSLLVLLSLHLLLVRRCRFSAQGLTRRWAAPDGRTAGRRLDMRRTADAGHAGLAPCLAW